MASRNVSFNGNNLQTAYIFVNDIDDASAPTRELSIYALGHANASKIPYDQYSSKNITLSGTLYGDTIVDLDSRIDTFKGYFNGIDKNLDVDYNNITRRYTATMQSISISRPGGLAYATFTVRFVTTLPFGRDSTSTVLCNYTQRELITNSQFSSNTTGWTAYNGAAIARTNAGGRPDLPTGFAMSITTTGTGSFPLQGASGTAVTVTNGSTYTLSFYVKGAAGTTVRCQITDTVDTYNTIVTDGTWQRVSVTKTVTSASVTPYAIIEGSNTSVKLVYVDWFLLEAGSSPTSFFDSSIANSNQINSTFVFNGTAPLQQPIVTVQLISGIVGSGTINLSNNTTGQQVTVTRTWALNDIMVIDSTNKTVFVNNIETDFVGAFPEFAPGTGILGYSSSFSPTFTYKVEYYPQYL